MLSLTRLTIHTNEINDARDDMAVGNIARWDDAAHPPDMARPRPRVRGKGISLTEIILDLFLRPPFYPWKYDFRNFGSALLIRLREPDSMICGSLKWRGWAIIVALIVDDRPCRGVRNELRICVSARPDGNSVRSINPDRGTV